MSLRADVFLIKNVTLIDGTGAPARHHTSILVRGDKIVLITSGAVGAAKGVAVIDGTGKFLIPGLWDMHVHLWESYHFFPLYIANGVVGLRDMGSDYARTTRWRREVRAGTLMGPRIYTSGPALMGPTGSEGKLPVIRIATTADAQRAINAIDDLDVDFADVLSNIPRDTYFAVAQRARLLRLPFAGHVPDSVSVLEAVEERQHSIEHMMGLPLAFSSQEHAIRIALEQARAANDPAAIMRLQERIEKTFDEKKAIDVLQRCSRFKSWQVPTLGMWQRTLLRDDDYNAHPELLKYIPKSIRATWQDRRAQAGSLAQEDAARHHNIFGTYLRYVELMKRANADVLAGTDTGDPYAFPGFALHDELALLVRAGMTPMEAIQAASRNAARYFNIDATTGTVERGKTADLVLLDADPLSDIHNTRKIAAVVLRGTLLTRKRLDGLLEQVQAVK